MLPKISVITVCRNVASQLAETIQAVKSQSYPNIEYIVIDGASTDNTVDVIKQHQSYIDYWISEPDNGIYDAMNKGLHHATGEWVSFINVGDKYADDNVLMDIFGNAQIPNKYQLIGGNTNNMMPNGEIVVHHAEQPEVIPYRIPFCHQSCFTRRVLLGSDTSFQFDIQYKLAADYNSFYLIYYKYGKDSIKIVDRVIANYLQEGSTSLVNYRKAKKEYLKIQSAHPNVSWVKELVKYLTKKC